MFRSQQHRLSDSEPALRSSTEQATPQQANPLWQQMALNSVGAQAKLTVGPANDAYEEEADAVADQVMRMPDPQAGVLQRQPLEEEEEMLQPKLNTSPPVIQRLCPECEDELQRQPIEEEEEMLQAKRPSGQSETAPSGLGDYVSGLSSSGRPLPDADKHFFESRFSRDFSDVRLHTDPRADEATRSINALAFTKGNNIVLGRGQYQSGSESSRRLLAHELTHVVQQRGDGGEIQTKPDPSIQRKERPCEDKIGTCEFYECLSARTPGDRANGYYWNYGRKYCHRFNQSSLMNDPKSARWLDCVTLNLHRALLNSCVQHGDDLEKVKQCAYATHAKVYTDCGICELDKTFLDQIKVMFTPDAGDLWTSDGLKQVLESAGRCFFRPFGFQMIIDKFTSWGNLDEAALGRTMAGWAKGDPVAKYPLILGIIELLSNTFDDDDVAYECMLSLSDSDLDTLEGTADGRRILFVFKHALSGGVVYAEEQAQIDRIGNRSQR